MKMIYKSLLGAAMPLLLSGGVAWANALSVTGKERCDTWTMPTINRPFSPDKVVFLVLGDHGSGQKPQERVARGMAKIVKERENKKGEQVRFVLFLGDNFYPHGVDSIRDPQWKTTFENMYPHQDFPMPFHAIIGNHDARSNVHAQLEYGLHHCGSGRWSMISDQDILEFGGEVDKAPLLRLVTLNSMISVRQQVTFAQCALDPNATAQERTHCPKHVDQAVWKLVAGHFPLRSSGKHGWSGQSNELLGQLMPRLKSWKVDGYLAGHDHHQELIRQDGEPLLLISGAGGSEKLYEDLNRPVNGSLYRSFGHYGFALVELTRNKMRVTLHDQDASPLRTHEVTK
ncbi:MAG: metallophosphoesterase [Magnetococcales bacterium]|nr:metallophosphoesterase [Magnetococcales bacterium]